MKHVKISPFIQSLEKIVHQKNCFFIYGYRATASAEAKTRIYFNKTALDSFMEVDSSQILDAAHEDKDDEFLVRFVISSDARVIFSSVADLTLTQGEEKSCNCGCQHSTNDQVARQIDPMQSIRLLLCHFGCLLRNQECIKSAMGRGLSHRDAEIVCQNSLIACQGTCPIRI